MSVTEIKKYFTKNSSINFLNEFTLQDVEDAKKQIFMKNYKTQGEAFKTFLDKASEKIAKDKFFFSVKEEQGVAVKNTVRDVLNANYKNTISRMILVDSQYRQQLNESETDFLLHFNEKVTNAISLEVTNIEIPYTFYNIEEAQGNDHFIVSTIYEPTTGERMEDYDNVTITTTTVIKIPDGHYDTIDQVIVEINKRFVAKSLNLSCEKDPITHRIQFKNESRALYDIQFLTPKSKVNNCLGWNLGFREYHLSAISGQTNRELGMVYQLPKKGLNLLGVDVPGYIYGTCVAMVPHIKYFVLAVEDFNQTQTADTMIQPNIKPENTKATSHFTQDPMLNYLLPHNLNSYLETMTDRTLTKAQLFTIAQQNLEKQNLTLQNTRLEVQSTNQVLGMIPFEECKAVWGKIYFSDKSKYVREYHSPTNLERIQVKLYDDKGNLLNLRGNNWCMTLTTHNLYKY